MTSLVAVKRISEGHRHAFIIVIHKLSQVMTCTVHGLHIDALS